jgi:hypothetical protein
MRATARNARVQKVLDKLDECAELTEQAARAKSMGNLDLAAACAAFTARSALGKEILREFGSDDTSYRSIESRLVDLAVTQLHADPSETQRPLLAPDDAAAVIQNHSEALRAVVLRAARKRWGWRLNEMLAGH